MKLEDSPFTKALPTKKTPHQPDGSFGWLAQTSVHDEWAIGNEKAGDFVGHAMVGYQNVEPVFVLPSGVRKFTFTCDGFKTTSAELKVLGTGSTQYLIVKLPTNSPAEDDQSAAKPTVN